MKYWTLTALCALSLVGCAAQNRHPVAPKPDTVAPANPQQAWQQRQDNFARMSSWQLQGRAGIQFRDQSVSFGLNWQQQGKDNYTIIINNPLTDSPMAVLQGNGNSVTLRANEQVYQDTSAENLLQRQLKVSLPLAGMKYWVRGVPDPEALIEEVQLDNFGRPQILQQAGWRVEYTGWQGEGSNALPERLKLSRVIENTQVKVVAKEWKTAY